MTYVNPGPDARPLGRLGGLIQGALSFRSPVEYPLRWSFHIRDWLVVFVGWPPFLSVFVRWPKTGPKRWASLRIGWRWDAYWGDQDVPPIPPFGGYIADVVVKLWFDRLIQYGRAD